VKCTRRQTPAGGNFVIRTDPGQLPTGGNSRCSTRSSIHSISHVPVRELEIARLRPESTPPVPDQAKLQVPTAMPVRAPNLGLYPSAKLLREDTSHLKPRFESGLSILLPIRFRLGIRENPPTKRYSINQGRRNEKVVDIRSLFILPRRIQSSAASHRRALPWDEPPLPTVGAITHFPLPSILSLAEERKRPSRQKTQTLL
jgi:hypothetical protein